MPTIGVALPIPEPWGRELQDYRISIGDVAAAQIPTHITLVPPIETTGTDLGLIRDHLAAVAAGFDSFGVRLQGTGTFRPISPVVFVTVAHGFDRCTRLAEQVRRGPLDVSLQFEYHPHVTVAHQLPDPALDRAHAELADFTCEFTADSFHLYEHDPTRGWQPTGEFTLAPTAALA
ncbi:MAG: 2'-5' RNA ligase family protein [Nocardioides sp.]|uniref:2'-5' RNA ligase family protein n=1 Tax=Nocardioides sp. TaxID=35761 RepID=UPI0039E22473